MRHLCAALPEKTRQASGRWVVMGPMSDDPLSSKVGIVVLLAKDNPAGTQLMTFFFGGVFVLSLVSNIGQQQRT